MSRSNSQYQNLSPDQQELLMAALTSNRSDSQPARKGSKKSPNQSVSAQTGGSSRENTSIYQNRSSNGSDMFDSPNPDEPGSGQLDFNGLTESPYLEYDPEFDDQLDFDSNSQDMIGDLPGTHSPEERDLHEKRKSLDGKDDEEEGGGKRRESEDKASKKPGRKPMTNEPTSKRKAQNRAAQRAFRERKEKHLKDLETKVEDLEKVSESTNHENGLLKAQVERLQIELREYRKRLSWVSNSGVGRSPPLRGANTSPSSRDSAGGLTNNDFQFDFPKFGDLPTNHMLARSGSTTTTSPATARSTSSPSGSSNNISGALPRNSVSNRSTKSQTQFHGTSKPSNTRNTLTASPESQSRTAESIDSLSGLFSPSILEATRNAPEYFPQQNSMNATQPLTRKSVESANFQQTGLYSHSSASNTDSPASSTDSQQQNSSIGTSPEPSLSSPNSKLNDFGLDTINEENQGQGQRAQGFGNFGDNVSGFGSTGTGTGLTPVNELSGFNWLAQQNNGAFDPVLFGDYREPQDAMIGQDFGTFFNEAFPLPDLESPYNTYDNTSANISATTSKETPPVQQIPSKADLMKKVDAAQNGDDEVYPGEDRSKMMTCNKIWDRLNSLEKFHTREIDMDNLCTELRAKARCSEGGAVVPQKDVENILDNAK